jgi:hypothetical protein
MNRACQVHTTGFDFPDRRMISAVPQPSAVARITLARHTCFCGALRSATITSTKRLPTPKKPPTCTGTPALHIATQLRQCVGRDRRALGRAQALKAFSGLFIRLMIRFCFATRLSRSRFGRLASSSWIVGIATILHDHARRAASRERRVQLGVEPVCLGTPATLDA